MLLSIMGQLLSAGDPPATRCALCPKPASGPCARCRRLICADCCVLAEGGAGTFALCLDCEHRGGTSLTPAWLGLLGWLGLVMLGLLAIAAALALLR
jgi:hypothetical protein